jgi:hypothetical protein
MAKKSFSHNTGRKFSLFEIKEMSLPFPECGQDQILAKIGFGF